MTKILVTGGCGYIGSRLVPALLEDCTDVTVVDLQLFGNGLAALNEYPCLSVLKADIRNRALMERALEGVDTVIHLAAMSNDPSTDLAPQLSKEINLDATLFLLEAARRQGVARFINASTVTVYGVREEQDVDETFDHRPISLYGEFKSMTDRATAEADAAGFTTVNVRAATVCGLSPRLRLDLTVNVLTVQAVLKGKITVHGGAQMRPNVVIDDLVQAYVLLSKAPQALIGGESFNISVSNLSVLGIAELIVERVNPKAKIHVEPIFDCRSYHVSSRKFSELLGFEYLFDIEDGAAEVARTALLLGAADLESSIYRNVEHLQNIAFV